jgi:hypothetical protein
MPIGILKFKLPEEQEEFDLARKAGALHCVLWDLSQWLRAKSKYEDVDTLTVDEIREKLVQLKDEYDIKD